MVCRRAEQTLRADSTDEAIATGKRNFGAPPHHELSASTP